MAITMLCWMANQLTLITGKPQRRRFRKPVRKCFTTTWVRFMLPWIGRSVGWTWRRDDIRSVSCVWEGTAVRPASTSALTMSHSSEFPRLLQHRRSKRAPVPPKTTASFIAASRFPLICEQLKKASAGQRAEIVRAIGSFGSDAAPAVNPVMQALGDADPDVRSAAAWAFSQMAGAGVAAVPALEKALADSNPRVRSLSAVALWSMGPKAVAAVPALITALNDPIAYVRAPAADALGNIGPSAKAAVQPLSERLLATDEQAYVLRSVASALGSIGPDAAGALPALQEALKMHRVTYTAHEAILKIKKEPVPMW